MIIQTSRFSTKNQDNIIYITREVIKEDRDHVHDILST